MPLRISQAGVRGTVGRGGLTAKHALDFGAAFAKFLPREGPVYLARDPRASSVMLREGLASSLMAAGRDVVDLGLASTPVLQHTIRRTGAAGGVSIGASHNAAEWNALKFFGPEGAYLTTAEADELLDLYHLRTPSGGGRLGGFESFDAIDPYLDDLERAFDFDSLRRFRVVVDCSNGTSSPILARLNERFGFRFVLINAATDGSFAHVPSTSARMVALQLAPLIVPLSADAGFLFDADSDRVGFATERGDPVNEELILPLAADHLLAGTSGKIVLTNLSTTSLNEEIAAKHGATAARVPVGRNAAADALGAYPPGQIALAGEGTGAVMIPKFRFVYDGIATMLTLLEMLAARGEPFSAIAQALPRYEMLKEEIPLARRRIPQMLETLGDKFSAAEINRLDGLRAELDDAWFHVRVSQTEPLVRAIAEAPGEAPRALFDEVLDVVRSFA
ncbi:MAG: hypothetical protein SFV18_16075 [Bryobacteraceae bacterium]|nr:hypothetical protein [Bryobacteraceae bacterium]